MIEKHIEDILNNLNIPFDFEEYTGNAGDYIVYAIRDMQDTDYSDDSASEEEYLVIIHYWTNKSNKIEEWQKIKEFLKSEGFEFRTMKGIKEDEFFGRLMQFTYKKGIQENEKEN